MSFALTSLTAALLCTTPSASAQSFFGIPLFEDGSEPASESDPAAKQAAEAQVLPMDQWPAELSELWSTYRNDRAAGLYKVNAHYLSRLEELKQSYSAAGNLEDAISTKEEIERVTTENAALEDRVDLPPLRKVGRADSPLSDVAWTEYEAQMEMKTRGVSILSQRLVESVEALKIRLTQQDQLKAALTCAKIAEVLEQEFVTRTTHGGEGEPVVERMPLGQPGVGSSLTQRTGGTTTLSQFVENLVSSGSGRAVLNGDRVTISGRGFVSYDEAVSPPFTLKLKFVNTGELRVHYAAEHAAMIFNWSDNPMQFRYFEYIPGKFKGAGVKGKGFLEPGEEHELVWSFGTDEVEISVDGDTVHRFTPQEAALSGRIGLGTLGRSEVHLLEWNLEKN